ncbi:MAG: peptidase [Planctomycetaceae bacterium]|nr:peptidase [Planctomycetaceae bacterium]|tara:strand:- start:10497 stop:11072 length:576 start_codon:yes stop_codon:yes gene_type:complete
MAKVLMPLGDATEALDTFYPFFRLKEAGYEVVVAGPEARLYHTVLHEIPPDSSIAWDITQERPGYFIKADIAFQDVNPDEYAGVFISGGRAPEYLRYDDDLNRVVKAIHDAGKPIASVCHGIEILTSAGIINGRNVTTVAKCAMDAEQGGGVYVDQETVVDGNIVSARTWHDNAPLMKTFLEMLDAATTAG